MAHRTTLIKHYPIARQSLVRIQIANRSDGCAFCGGTNAYKKLFRYGIESDSIGSHTQWDDRAFCSIGCRNAYY